MSGRENIGTAGNGDVPINCRRVAPPGVSPICRAGRKAWWARETCSEISDPGQTYIVDHTPCLSIVLCTKKSTVNRY